MSIPTHFKSGRTGSGAAYVSDHEGSPHARFMRLSAYALAPLGVLSAWWLAGIVGKSYDGMIEIIVDYVHDEELKQRALCANKWAARAIAAIWTLAILIIAAPK